MNLPTEGRQSRGRGTRTAVGQEAKLLERSSWFGTAQPSPSLVIEFDIADVTRELDDLSTLEADWDDEDAFAIDLSAIVCAKDVVSKIAQSVEVSQYAWQRPSVAPMKNGGVTLSWRLARHRLLLIFRPAGQGIVFVQTPREGEPIRRPVSCEGAINRIVNSLSNQ